MTKQFFITTVYALSYKSELPTFANFNYSKIRSKWWCKPIWVGEISMMSGFCHRISMVWIRIHLYVQFYIFLHDIFSINKMKILNNFCIKWNISNNFCIKWKILIIFCTKIALYEKEFFVQFKRMHFIFILHSRTPAMQRKEKQAFNEIAKQKEKVN